MGVVGALISQQQTSRRPNRVRLRVSFLLAELNLPLQVQVARTIWSPAPVRSRPIRYATVGLAMPKGENSPSPTDRSLVSPKVA